MHDRFTAALSLALFTLAGGCASAELPEPDGGDVPGLAAYERDSPVVGDLFIEVERPDGSSVAPDAVTIVVDGDEVTDAVCVDKEGGACVLWVGDFEAWERVTAWVDLCGHRFAGPLSLAPGGISDEAGPMSAQVTVVAVDSVCGARRHVP
ncbi:MAG: hypothetical protein AAGA54_26430 [Myxococcota bacterium]